MNLDLKDITNDEELAVLEEGLKSRFWAVYSARFQHMVFTTMGAALSQKAEGRDWLAGKASGMKEAMQYPAKRVRDLKTKSDQEKVRKSTPL